MPFVQPLRDQSYLLPPSIDDWLPREHPARFVWIVVGLLDLEALGIRSLPCEVGRPSYPPRELLACWLYGFMVRVRSSRGLEKACRECLPFMWLSGLLQPDHSTFWRFRKSNQEVMRKLFKKMVSIAFELGMIELTVQSVDGTKVPVASSNRVRRKRYLEQILKAVEQEIAELEAEDDQDVPPDRSDSRKRAKAHKEDLLTRVQQALAQVEEAEQQQGRKGSSDPVALVSDPDARLMKTRDGWKAAYNAQVLVDGKEQIIVAADVTQDNYDCDQLIPLLEQEQEEFGRCAEATLADNGYYSVENLQRAQEYTDLFVPDKTFDTKLRKAPVFHLSKFTYVPEEDVYICPCGKQLCFVRHTKIKGRAGLARQYQCRDCNECPCRPQCTKSKAGRVITRTPDLAVQEAHREKMGTQDARDKLRLRPHMVEAVFGILKEQQGARRFLTRGLHNVSEEWYLLCAAFNLRKMCNWWLQGMVMTV